jgi:hypothetical protein
MVNKKVKHLIMGLPRREQPPSARRNDLRPRNTGPRVQKEGREGQGYIRGSDPMRAQIGIAVQRHRRAGRIQECDGKLVRLRAILTARS